MRALTIILTSQPIHYPDEICFQPDSGYVLFILSFSCADIYNVANSSCRSLCTASIEVVVKSGSQGAAQHISEKYSPALGGFIHLRRVHVVYNVLCLALNPDHYF